MTDEVPADVIHSGISFLRDLSTYYGDQRAMQLWENMREGMGRDVQNAILMTMLRGGYERRAVISMAAPREIVRMINGIKEVRSVTGYGLKDAKDLIQNVMDIGPQRITLQHDADVRNFKDNMTDFGFNVNLM